MTTLTAPVEVGDLGEVFDPLGTHFEDPYPIYAYAREHAPVFFSPRLDAWVVTRYDDVRAVLRDPEVYSSANALRPLTPIHPRALDVLMSGHPFAASSITTDGAEQRVFRGLLTRALTPKRVAAQEAQIRRHAEELVDAFVADGHTELMSRFAYPLPLATIGRIAGLAPEDLPAIRSGSVGLSALTFGQLPEDEQVAAAQEMLGFQRVLLAHLIDRRRAPRDDALSVIATTLAPGDGPLEFLQEASLLSAAQELVLPGHSTSVAMIGNGLIRLLEHRDQWQVLIARPDLLGRAVEEIARFDNPVHGFLRVTTRTTELGGVALPPGAEVLLVYSSANRDRALCEDPDTFDITRAPTHHLGFALGAHFCPGAGLGRLQVGIALETLMRRLPTLRIDPGHPIRIRRDYTMRGPEELHVEW